MPRIFVEASSAAPTQHEFRPSYWANSAARWP